VLQVSRRISNVELVMLGNPEGFIENVKASLIQGLAEELNRRGFITLQEENMPEFDARLIVAKIKVLK
jgi:hypothetical protein